MTKRSVETSATEERVGSLHDTMVTLMQRKLDALLKRLSDGDEDGNPVDELSAIDLKELAPILTFLDKQDIGPRIDSANAGKDSGVRSKIEELRRAHGKAMTRRDSDEPPGILEH